MARIGKCNCGGEFYASEISNDKIFEVTCKKCKKEIKLKEPIVPKWKRNLINEFNKKINNIQGVKNG